MHDSLKPFTQLLSGQYTNFANYVLCSLIMQQEKQAHHIGLKVVK